MSETRPNASITVLRNMKRENQMAALRRMLDTHLERARLVQKHIGEVTAEINRLKRLDAEDAGHVRTFLGR